LQFFVFHISGGLIEPLETSLDKLKTGKPLCQTCGKVMKNVKALKLHTRIHEGSQKHKCNNCPKKYNKKNDLEDHLRSWHGASPLKCAKCPKTFMNKNYFNKHVKICGIPGLKNASPFHCDICAVRFQRRSQLMEHEQAKHDRIAKYSCVKCGVHYRWRSSLFEHRKKCTSK